MKHHLTFYHLADDVGETKNLAAEQPERVRAMQAAWKQWDAENREPLWQEAPSLPSHQAKVEVFPTEIRVQCTGNDPQLILSEIPAGTRPFTLELKVKSTTAGPGELFWATTDAPQFVPGQSVPFQLQHDGQAWRYLGLRSILFSFSTVVGVPSFGCGSTAGSAVSRTHWRSAA